MPSEPFQFHISDAAQVLGLKAVCFVIEGVRNQPTHPDFEKLKAQTLAQVTADLSSEAIQADPVLGGFRALHDAIGRSNRKNALLTGDEAARKRVICDFLAGMTDSYALRFYSRLFVPGEGSFYETL